MHLGYTCFVLYCKYYNLKNKQKTPDLSLVVLGGLHLCIARLSGLCLSVRGSRFADGFNFRLLYFSLSLNRHRHFRFVLLWVLLLKTLCF